MKTENLIKAAQTADLLSQDLHASFSDAVASGNDFAGIVLLDLLGQARELATKINNARDAALP